MKALGIFHMSADRDISYADFGVQLARKINVPVQLVQPVKSTNSGIQIAPIPKHTTLGSERIKNELGLHPPTVFETIDCL
jgi:dTDP-4-dehydrorhamnose reductase